MGNLVSLSTVRKQAARKQARQQANENAVKFGRTKAQKTREEAIAAAAKAVLDGAKRD